MSYSGETNEECCLSPLDSARFIMERAKYISINLVALEKLLILFVFLFFILNRKYFDFDIFCNDAFFFDIYLYVCMCV